MAEHNFLDMPCGIMDQFVTSMAVPGRSGLGFGEEQLSAMRSVACAESKREGTHKAHGLGQRRLIEKSL